MSKKNKKNNKSEAQKASQLSAAERTKNLVQKMMLDKDLEEATSIVKKAEEHRDQVEEELKQKIEKADAHVAGAKETAKSEADKILEEARKKAKEITDNASEKAKLIVDNASDEIKEKIKSGVINRAKELEREVELKKKELEYSNASLVAELKAKKEAHEKKSQELEEKLKNVISETAKLEEDRSSFKSSIQGEFKKELENLIKERDELLENIGKLEKQIKSLDNVNKSLTSEQEFYEDQLTKYGEVKRQLDELQLTLDDWKSKYQALDEAYKRVLNEKSTLAAQILQYGEDPQVAFNKIKELEEELKKYKDHLADCPDTEELAALREKAVRYEEALNRIKVLTTEKSKLEYENTDLKGNQSELENSRRMIKILELQKSELERELDRTRDMYEKRSKKIFANLSVIDDDPVHTFASDRLTLRELCEKFRSYLQYRYDTPLYYDEDKIRTFIAGFASSRLMILEGLSGTGKTWLPRAFMQFITKDSVEVKALEIPVQSSWKDRNDLLGFYNDFKKQYKETEFLKALYTALHDPNTIYLIVLDEMNLSRIEYYFADVLSVMEKPMKDWEIELISDYASLDSSEGAWPKCMHHGKIRILNNVWFIGTANKDDSTFLISDKVYDRSTVIEFIEKGQFDVNLKKEHPIFLNNDTFNSMLDDAVTKYKEHDKYMKLMNDLDKMVFDCFQVTFGNRIQNQLKRFVPVYVECGGTVEEAIDIVFSKKVLRKLEDRYDQETKEGLEILLDNVKTNNPKLVRTIETIEKMIRRI